VSLCDGVVQGCVAGAVGRVERTPALDQQVHHRHRADGGGAMEGVLAALVAHASRGRRFLFEQLAGEI
jgi:hypothetical protein